MTFNQFITGLEFYCKKCNSKLVKQKGDICLSCNRDLKLNQILK
jgi:hypothetical protein